MTDLEHRARDEAVRKYPDAVAVTLGGVRHGFVEGALWAQRAHEIFICSHPAPYAAGLGYALCQECGALLPDEDPDLRAKAEQKYVSKMTDKISDLIRTARDDADRISTAIQRLDSQDGTEADDYRYTAAMYEQLADALENHATALREIERNYANQDMNHVDFRVGAYQAAWNALNP